LGIGILNLNLLAWAEKTGVNFRRTLTVGRQGFLVDAPGLAGFLRDRGRPDLAEKAGDLLKTGFCERLLEAAFGAREVLSVDASKFEGAPLIRDLNFPFAEKKKFSAILDFGCLEHVYNFPVAIDSLVASCEEGGHLIHSLPSNNACGHGFYQFSPEAFFSLYSPARGFAETEVFLVETGRPSAWYQLRSTLELRKRIMVVNSKETYVLVKTKKLKSAKPGILHPPQQSDYVPQWEENKPMEGHGSFRRRVVRYLKTTGMFDLARRYYYGLGRKRTDIVKWDFEELMKKR
jgi:hypothetical protein